MAKSVYYRVEVYDVRNQRSLGVKKIITTCVDPNEVLSVSWDRVNHPTDPTYTLVKACNKVGIASWLVIAPAGRSLTQIALDCQKPLPPDTLCGMTGHILLSVPDNATEGEVLWELRFSDTRVIKIQNTTNYIKFLFYKNGSSIGEYSARCGANWGTQWGYYRCAVDYIGFPCINSNKSAVSIPLYSTFCAYWLNVDSENFRGGMSVQAYQSPNTWNSFFDDYDPINDYDEDNPYFDGGTSEEGGGNGNFSDDSDTVDEDDLPVIDAIGTGFATLFSPSKSQLQSLSTVMWNGSVFAALQNLVENIEDMFTSLAIVPFEVSKGSTVEVTWFDLPITNIFLTLASQQYYEFDMGSINLAEDSRIYTSGSALDYSPFSKLGIFLPFIGFQELDIDECRDATIGLKYRIDILSGTCVALISVSGNTIYQFSGNCLSQIPITNENMQSLVSDAVNVGIAAVASHAASGAASADMTAAESTQDTAAREAKMAHAESHLVSSQGRLASATANAAMGMKPTFGKAGAISASASLLAVKQPYLFLTTPRQSIPDHYQRYCGFPSNISGKLNTFSGFTVVEDIRLNGLVATSPEVAEIYQLLKNGVII